MKLSIVGKQEEYEIVIGKSLQFYSNSSKKFVITDENLLLTAKKVFNGIQIITIKPGEGSKNLRTISNLTNKCLKLGMDRKSCIIALGGGVVGDIAGFLAGTFMRGIDYIQVPTSLLAMVDSAIGGKVGVDVEKGKNISGLFYHPKKVLISTAFLTSLPYNELKNGLAEIIKYAIIYDEELFKYLEKNLDKLLKLESDALLHVITRSCEIKISIVQKDEKESGLRMILNFGHTIGHAIETISKYKVLHGEAVCLGMILESRLANKMGLLSRGDLDRVESIIKKVGFITKKYPGVKLMKIMHNDKKAFNNKIRFVFPTRIGKVIVKECDEVKILDVLN